MIWGVMGRLRNHDTGQRKEHDVALDHGMDGDAAFGFANIQAVGETAQ